MTKNLNCNKLMNKVITFQWHTALLSIPLSSYHFCQLLLQFYTEKWLPVLQLLLNLSLRQFKALLLYKTSCKFPIIKPSPKKHCQQVSLTAFDRPYTVSSTFRIQRIHWCCRCSNPCVIMRFISQALLTPYSLACWVRRKCMQVDSTFTTWMNNYMTYRPQYVFLHNCMFDTVC